MNRDGAGGYWTTSKRFSGRSIAIEFGSVLNSGLISMKGARNVSDMLLA